MRIPVLIAFLASLTLKLSAQWDADAGLYIPYTRYPGVVTSVSSGADRQAYINDGDVKTQWISKANLPSGFVTRADLNALYKKGNASVTSSGSPDFDLITDGSFYGLSRVSKGISGPAWMKVNFPSPEEAERVYTRVRSFTDSIHIYVFNSAGDSSLLASVAPNAYTWTGWDIPYETISAIGIYSDEDFNVNELAVLAQAPTEEVTVDMGTLQGVDKLRVRYYTPAATAVEVYTSSNGSSWTRQGGTLDPTARNSVNIELASTTDVRYIRVNYTLNFTNYAKAQLWEVSAMDKTYPYGPLPTAAQSTASLNDMIGINAFWGWNYNRYTDQLQPGEGPEMYDPVANYARDYHNMNWDLDDPDDDISFTDMATSGTPANSWLNWDREYQAWIDKGLPVQASLQFVHFEDSLWDSPYSSAYKYGFAFGRYFGPTYGNGKVSIVEVGNEPWQYDSALYRTLLRGMARGLRDADSNLVILPCALQADDPLAEGTSYAKNYIGARITSLEADLIDGLNLHMYSFYKGSDGVRRAVHPEHLGSKMRGIHNAIRWRDENMPGKPIYVTEWGWDHDGGGQDCIHNECVTEQEASDYVTRAMFIMQRMGIERATYFFHCNLWGNTLFTRSGLTGGKEVNFIKKKSFYAMQALLAQIGDKHFLSIVQEDDDAWMYLLGDENGTPTHLVAWRPIDGGDVTTTQVQWATAYEAQSAILLDGADSVGTSTTLPVKSGGNMTLTLRSTPVIIALGSAGGRIARQSDDREMEVGDEAIADASLIAGMGDQPIIEDPMSQLEEGQKELSPVSSPRILLLPNPAREVLTIHLGEDIDPKEVYQIGVWDFTGRKHYSQVNNIGKVNEVWVADLPAGAYKFIAFMKDGTQFTQTISVVN